MTVGKFYPHKPAPLIIISQNKHSCCWSYQGGMLSMCEVSEYWVVSPETKSSRSYDRLTTKCGNCTESELHGGYLLHWSLLVHRGYLLHWSLLVHRGYLLTTLQWVLVALRLLYVYTVQRVTCQLQPPTISQCAERNSVMGLLFTFLQGADCSENHQTKVKLSSSYSNYITSTKRQAAVNM